MDNKEWSDIIVKCAEDYTKLKSMDKVETPPRDFIRAWMQINYSIFKLSGHFFRMFNSVLRTKYDEGTRLRIPTKIPFLIMVSLVYPLRMWKDS